ncbi:hypothetical protein Scep_025906 [Stephania cephalantha]|uniref:Uncharacterized protein n=1 Tax=Stephania cephalantha TaxID=152367 RepID=A0AAP0HRL2_9MAGN
MKNRGVERAGMATCRVSEESEGEDDSSPLYIVQQPPKPLYSAPPKKKEGRVEEKGKGGKKERKEMERGKTPKRRRGELPTNARPPETPLASSLESL